MPAPSVNLIYKLEGEFEDGIDVFALAPVLLSVGQLIQESNKTVNPAGDEITVNVKPFEEGCFIVDIALVPANVLEQIARTLLHTDLSNIKTLLKCIGLIGGGTITGGATLYKLMKVLRGPPKETKTLPDGSVSYTAQHGTQIIVNGPVHNLFQNPVVAEAAARSIVAPLENEKVTDIKTYLKADEEHTAVKFDREDAKALQATVGPRLIAQQSAQGSDVKNTNTVYLHPKKVDLEGMVGSWSFRKAGSRQILRARIKDYAFLEQVKSHDVVLDSRDVLRVELVEKQEFKDGEYHLSNEITRVVSYEPAPKQMPMMLDAPTAPLTIVEGPRGHAPEILPEDFEEDGEE